MKHKKIGIFGFGCVGTNIVSDAEIIFENPNCIFECFDSS